MPETTQVQLRKLGAAVRVARRAEGVSQEDFAGRCDIPRSHMSEIERGRANITYYTLAAICRGLRVRPSELLAAARL
jgi:transcriptional regulator with XRE-family HTH domain